MNYHRASLACTFDNLTLSSQKVLVISAERNEGLFLYLPGLMIITIQNK